MANRLHFQKQSEATPVASTQAGDVVIGLRNIDFISIPLALLGNLPVSSWDAAATEANVPLEVVPFTRLEEITTSPVEWSVPPTTNVGKTSLVKAAATVGDTSIAGQLAGRLPDTGKFWFVVNTDAGIMDVAGVNWLEVNFSRQPNYVNADSADVLAVFGYAYDRGWLGGTSFADGLTGVRKYLLCVDIDAGKIDVYASTGLVATQTIAPIIGTPALAGAFINCAIFIYDGAAGELSFSVTGADTPYAIPGAYLPLVLREANPTDAAGKLNRATSNSVLHDVKIVAGRSYYIDKDTVVFEIPVARDTPRLRSVNTFTEKQSFPSGFDLGLQYTLMGQNSGLALTNTTSPLMSQLSSAPNVVYGSDVFGNMITGQYNVGIGLGLAQVAIQSFNGVVIGYGLGSLTQASDAVAIGSNIGASVMQLEGTTLVGASAGNVTGYNLQQCVALGYQSMSDWVADAAYPSGTPIAIVGNTVVGSNAWNQGQPGNYNTIVGHQAFTYTGPGTYGPGVAEDNTVIGAGALTARQGDNSRNTVIGKDAMASALAADENVVLGYQSAWGIVGGNNVAVGTMALKNATQGAGTNTNCTAVGDRTMQNLTGTDNSTALGKGATVTGSNQVQLGDAATTAYAYGAVQNRSDKRDKREVRDTILGLDFILSLRPVDYKLDLREDYIDYSTRPQEPDPLRAEPQPPAMAHTEPGYQEALIAYRNDHDAWVVEKSIYDGVYRTWQREAAEWDKAHRMGNIATDGSKMRKRFHHGLIAQEVKAAADRMGVDFGGYQDHSIAGGQDVRSLGYEEFISPTIRAVQQLHEYVHSEAFEDRIAAKVLEKMLAARTSS